MQQPRGRGLATCGSFTNNSMLRSSFSGAVGRTYVLPLPPGKVLPNIPPGGFRSEAEIAALASVRVIDLADVAPGPSPDTYAFSRQTVQRNLYRIPLP